MKIRLDFGKGFDLIRFASENVAVKLYLVKVKAFVSFLWSKRVYMWDMYMDYQEFIYVSNTFFHVLRDDMTLFILKNVNVCVL